LATAHLTAVFSSLLLNVTIFVIFFGSILEGLTNAG